MPNAYYNVIYPQPQAFDIFVVTAPDTVPVALFQVDKEVAFYALLSRSQQWLQQHRSDKDRQVQCIEQVSAIFPDWSSPDMVHLLLITDEVLESLDELGTLHENVLKERETRTGLTRDVLPRPSDGVVDDHADKFHAGRPAGNYGPPIDPPPALIQLVYSLIVVAANSYPTEDHRVEATRPLLSQIFNTALHWNPARSLYDVELDAISEGHPPFLVVAEVKNEAGLHGDASLQAGLTCKHLLTALRFKVRLIQTVVRSSAVSWAILEIGVAMYTDGTYYDLLLSERLHLGLPSANTILRFSQAFAATREAISDLRVFYTQLDVLHLRKTASHLANSESARQSRVWLATMPRRPPSAGEALSASSPPGDAPTDSIEVVVKFTDRDHADAHKLLAAEHLAPALYACVPVYGDLFMVVMNRVEGEMACQRAVLWGEQRPYRIYEDVPRATTLLQLPRPRSGPDDGHRGMLVDLDWVGAHGRDRYSASLDESLQDWAIGIQRHGILDKAHDTAMLVRFKEKCHSAQYWDNTS
ncbi:hypothetical protein BD414DRAFT_517571 [Trametes punicea]|nr:hypothetical protein BD414DRAFT_517571 [Trametes punicea]